MDFDYPISLERLGMYLSTMTPMRGRELGHRWLTLAVDVLALAPFDVVSMMSTTSQGSSKHGVRIDVSFQATRECNALTFYKDGPAKMKPAQRNRMLQASIDKLLEGIEVEELVAVVLFSNFSTVRSETMRYAAHWQADGSPVESPGYPKYEDSEDFIRRYCSYRIRENRALGAHAWS